RPRLLRHERAGALRLQVHRVLSPRDRDRRDLERSGHRHRVADRRPAALGEGRRVPAALGHRGREAAEDGLNMSRAPKAILLVGAGGMLGRAFVERASRRGIEVVALDRPEVDLSRPETLAAIPWDAGDVVVNCAAFTDVDGAETSEA